MNDLSGDARECLPGHSVGVIECMVNGELNIFISNDDDMKIPDNTSRYHHWK